MTGPAHDFDDAERLARLRLIRSDNVGPHTFAGLFERFGSARGALDALPDLIRRGRAARPVKICSVEAAEKEMAEARRLGVRFVARGEAAYPAALGAIDAAPPLIGVKGDAGVMARPMVAIVGSRNASATGLIMTERLARGLAEAGYVVVSGLARGIDGKAHQSSLEAGTVAVLAGGHDRIYPSEHVGLARRLVEHGALVSEMPLGWEPRARDFPRRNRIVSGLSLGVVVVEASRRSGSLITARFAGEQGREVFAVPGSPLDARAEGTNDLLRQGATLCASADDVVAALAPLLGAVRDTSSLAEPRGIVPDAEPLWDEADLFFAEAPAEALAPPETAWPSETARPGKPARRGDPVWREPMPAEPPEECDDISRVEGLLGPAPVLIDDLIRASALPARLLQAALVELELRGSVRRHDGNRVSRAGGRGAGAGGA